MPCIVSINDVYMFGYCSIILFVSFVCYELECVSSKYTIFKNVCLDLLVVILLRAPVCMKSLISSVKTVGFWCSLVGYRM